jgi:hypothetical protein
MHRLVTRELSLEERAMQIALRAAVNEPGGREAATALVKVLAWENREVFFIASLHLLESGSQGSDSAPLNSLLLNSTEFLVELMRPERFHHSDLILACRDFLAIDPRLDIRLARLAPGRNEDPLGLDPSIVVNILDLLNEISNGPRLVLVLNHLPSHPDSRVASKAAILMGRRIQNSNWCERHYRSADPRIRASVIEALWGRNTAWARQLLRNALYDTNNRVLGNALVGLGMLGEPGVSDLLRMKLRDPQPAFRATAAWVMGKLGDLEFLEPLRAALADEETAVRQAARRALVTIRRPIVRQQQLEMMSLAAAVETESAPPPPPPPEPEQEPDPEYRRTSLFDFSRRYDGKKTWTR